MADPASVSGLRGRWRATQISSPPANGATLATWTDSSGNGFDATNGTPAQRPIYRTTGAFLPNGKTVVEFTAASSTEMVATVANNTAMTKFAVIRLKTLPSGSVLMPWYGMPNGYAQMAVSSGEFGSGVAGVTFLIDPAVNVGTVLSTGTWYACTFSANASNSASQWVNGSLDGTSSTSHSVTATQLFLGSRGATDYLDGYVAEVLDYSAVLTNEERAIVHTYIQDEYLITMADYQSSPVPGPAAAVHRSNRRLS